MKWVISFILFFVIVVVVVFFHSKTFLTHEGIRNSNKCVLHHPITLGGRLTLCQRQYLQSLRNPRPNTYTPRCQQDGKFERVQCEENKCFCVDTESGRMLRDTSLSKLFGEPRCDNKGKKKRIQKEKIKYFYTIITHLANETDWNHECLYVAFLTGHGLTLCQLLHEKAVTNSSEEIYIPQCKRNGNFEDVQCHGLSKECWCVNQEGQEVTGTRTNGTISCSGLGLFVLIFLLTLKAVHCLFIVFI